MEPESHVGRRVREIRSLRGLSLTACAQLAGMSPANLSRIEHGEQGVSRKLTLERLATALRVAPSELTGQPFRAASPEDVQSHAAVDALRGVLRDIEIGAVDPRLATVDDGIGALERDVDHVEGLRTACDYAAVGDAAPGLLVRAYLLVESGSARGRLLLARAFLPAFRLAKDLGYQDVAWAVARHMHAVANTMGDPAWIGIADFHLAEAMNGAEGRARALHRVQRTADELGPGDGEAGEVYGLLRLSAALQSAVLGEVDAVAPYLTEADDIARHTGDRNFAGQHFGPRNVGVWRMALAVETGDVESVPELAHSVDVAAIPSPGRQASFFTDLGRGLAVRRGHESAAVEAFRRAEDLAPQTTRINPCVREAVGDLLRRARRDAGGRELRGMAYRLGLGT